MDAKGRANKENGREGSALHRREKKKEEEERTRARQTSNLKMDDPSLSSSPT
jgi:hypothetical protein